MQYESLLSSLCRKDEMAHLCGWIIQKSRLHHSSEVNLNGIAGWTARCAELFPYSTYFKGAKSSASVSVANSRGSNHSDNGGIETVSDSVQEKNDLHSENGRLRDLVLS